MEMQKQYLLDHLKDVQTINARYYLFEQMLTLRESQIVTRARYAALAAYRREIALQEISTI